MKRVFIAIKINPVESMLEIFGDLKLHLKDERIKWVESENMHLTIAFLGDRDEDELKEICKIAEGVCMAHAPFSLQLRGLGVFRNLKTPRVIWLGTVDSSALEALAKSVRNKLREKGFFDEGKLFRPHLTLGRMKRIEDKDLFAEQIDNYRNTDVQTQLVDKIILYESILKPRGAEYHVLKEFNFV